ncbi:MAG: T9SS type A sorting domain-containing protein [Bacteroidetes bacterium]|nr:T9SS type A sorting domain-containing protein [Bacteroidota bacterium]
MKKALLLMLGAITSYSGFAQIDTMYNRIGGASNAQIDTLTMYQAQYGNGYLAGMNDGADNTGTADPATQVMGAAEAYNPTYNSTKSYKITGMLSAWGGSLNTVGHEKLTFHVWTVDNTGKDIAPTGVGMDSVAGFPGSVLASTGDSFGHLALNAAHGDIAIGTVKLTYTPFDNSPEVNTPFFIGYTFDQAYTYGSPADTVGLAETRTPAGTITAPGHDDYFINKGTYNLYQSRNCILQNNVWVDLYQEHGFSEFLAMVPIVELDPLSVGGVTKGGLTFSGAYPNPSIDNTNIKFSLTKNADVTVQIMDMSGRVLNTIQQKGLGNGEHTIQVSTANMAAGNYLYTVTTSNGDAIGSKLTVIK